MVGSLLSAIDAELFYVGIYRRKSIIFIKISGMLGFVKNVMAEQNLIMMYGELMSQRIIWNGTSYDVFEQGEIPLFTSSPAYIPPQEEDNSRSPDWDKVRDEFVKKQPYCSICESKKELQVHHIKPFHIFPELELVETNLIVLCRRDHFIIGHLMSWKSYNRNVLTDIKIWNKKIKNRP